MKIEINIKKMHLFIILGSFLLLGVLGFVIAQVPSVGHLSDAIWVPASVSGTAQTLNSFLGWLNGQVSSHTTSIASLQTGINNHEASIVQLQNNNPIFIPGTIAAGGVDGAQDGQLNCISNCGGLWGGATCPTPFGLCGGSVQCPSGTIERRTGQVSGAWVSGYYKICVRV